jgi:Spy/CpxP family protein refolding chaperone
MTPEQRAQYDSLLDLRSRATAEIMAIPRAKDDSMRAEITRKHRALLTPEQLKTLDDGVAEARRRQSERQKLCEQQQSGKNRSNTSKSK